MLPRARVTAPTVSQWESTPSLRRSTPVDAWSSTITPVRRGGSERHFVRHIVRLHSRGLRHLREPDRRWHRECRGDLGHPSSVPAGVGLLTAVSCASPVDLPRRERRRELRTQHHCDGQWRSDVDDRGLPRRRDQLHRHLVPGLPSLHRGWGLVGRSERRRPLDGRRWKHLGAADDSGVGNNPHWHFVLQRHDLPGHRPSSHRHNQLGLKLD